MHLLGFSIFLADAAAPAAGAPGPTDAPNLVSKLGPMPLFILMFVIMYFVLIRPQSVQRKQQMKLQESLKAGDKVVTVSGIVGVVITVKDKTVSLRSADAKMEVTRASITDVLERGGDEKSAS
jgi:preprotein translocase subunit YajC